MGKKKKQKVKVVYREVYRDAPKPVEVDVETQRAVEEPAIEITPERQQQAVSRLTAMLKALSAEPEPVKDMLFRLGIPWELKTLSGTEHFWKDDPEGEQYIIIKQSDLDAGELRNQEQGSIAKRIWGDMAEENLAQRAKEQAAQPLTGEVIQPSKLPTASDFADLMKKFQSAQEQFSQQQNGVN